MKTAIQLVSGIIQAMVGVLIICGVLPLITIAWVWAIMGGVTTLLMIFAGLMRVIMDSLDN